MTKPKIKIYGERNTGTNYLQGLIQLNLNAELLRGVVPWYVERFFNGKETAKDIYFKLTYHKNLGWKHSLVPSPEIIEKMHLHTNNLIILTITKNPYSWLLSLYHNPYHSKSKITSFKEFLTTPWKTVGRENFAGEFENPIVMWNKKNASYLRLENNIPCRNLRYEDLLADPESIIEKLSKEFSISKKLDGFKNVEESTKKTDGKDFAFYQDYYLKEEWKRKLDETEIDIINKYLDPSVMHKFGYIVLKA